MNELMYALFVLSLTAVVQAQENTACVDLSNWGSNNPVYFWQGYGPVGYPPARGAYIQILARPSGSTDEFVALQVGGGQNLPYGSTIMPLEINGMFDGGISLGIYGVEPYANAEFYARAWIGAVTWEKAVDESSAFIGMSPVFEDKTGSWGMAPGGPNSSPLYHFPSFTILPVPEPGTMALFALGGFFVLASIMGNRRH